MWLESVPSFLCLYSILDSTVRCLRSLFSFPFASFLDAIDHVLFLPKMLDYLHLGNLHFGVKGNMFHHLISFPGSPRTLSCRTIFIFMCSDITYYLDEALLSPVFQIICILTNTNVYILIVAVCWFAPLLIGFQSLVLMVFLCVPQGRVMAVSQFTHSTDFFLNTI